MRSLLAVVLTAALTLSASAQSAIDLVVSQCGRSVPLIQTQDRDGSSTRGSGVYLGHNYVLTAGHVIRDSNQRNTICFFGSRAIRADVHLTSRDCDTGLLHLTEDPGVPAIRLTQGIRSGQVLYAAGWDRGKRYRFFDGRVGNYASSMRGGRVFTLVSSPGESAMQGNSGGPVLTASGHLAGNVYATDRINGGGSETVCVSPQQVSAFLQRASQRYPDIKQLFNTVPTTTYGTGTPSGHYRQPQSTTVYVGGIPSNQGVYCPDGNCPTVPQSVPLQQRAVPSPQVVTPQVIEEVRPDVILRPNVVPDIQVTGETMDLGFSIPVTIRVHILPSSSQGLSQ